jgi:2,4-dienoyl-CoA reductase-like NADH-dependent reductase (Old Yellow Enzyme family)
VNEVKDGGKGSEEMGGILFEAASLTGGLELKNRIAMLAMTRTRAEVDGTPNELMVEHYRQRAGAGLIITESTVVSEVGRGYLHGPGMYTTEHALGWRKVVQAVHGEGGKIILQINHVGRVNNGAVGHPHSAEQPQDHHQYRTSDAVRHAPSAGDRGSAVDRR